MELGNARLPRENHVYRLVEQGVVQRKFGDPSVELTGKKLRLNMRNLTPYGSEKGGLQRSPPTYTEHLYIFHLVPHLNEQLRRKNQTKT